MALLFEKHLVERGFLTPEQALDAFDEQLAKRTPLGRLAVSNGKLTMAQVFTVLDAQAGTRRLFGEIAIEMGFLTAADVQDLLREQRRISPTLIDILERRGVATHKVLEAEYRNFLAVRDDEYARLIR
jgi:hypothetical protein